ncbi:MAG: cytochrome c [bacterium]|jgi:mono/diheme cytochrome c family protein|nr:cytochrome c [bacterium]MDP7074443.1 cytochrome c [Myxococcota bacterium]HJO25377.1 cytochrome c [Myxococcota bacterium]|tara:strand:- start:385 stop:891 length:507 start_codon:yes stop_codon:yes gene_type:complete
MLRQKAGSTVLSLSLLAVFLAPLLAHSQPGAAPASAIEGKQVFVEKCTACHTIGKGKLVGPDLSGVTVRREDVWLRRQIKEPDQLIAEGDPIVMELLKESNNVPMVPLGLSDTEIEAVIAYLKSTEQQASQPAGLPSRYVPTVLISIAAIIVFTLIGLGAGNKKVDLR